MADHVWAPIEPLSEADREIDLGAIDTLYESWWAARENLRKSSSENLRIFSERLLRRLSVETGILERIYDLDRGTTEALVTHGFVEELVSRSSTDVEPSRLIDILHDQEAAIKLVMDCVAKQRELNKGLILELHAILTRHQDTTSAIDQIGNRMEIPLLKGRLKEQPNNPQRPDGSVHEYCPPVHVETEIESILSLIKEYSQEDPVLVAAWLHHRFTQIHPFQDGNGRVARALTTLVLLRADLLPLVIDRDLRIEYIQALENADSGELAPLVSLFARLEKTAILQALSVNPDTEVAQQRSLTSAVIESLTTRFNKRRDERNQEFRQVNNLAKLLCQKARGVIERDLERLRAPVSELGEPKILLTDGGPDYGNEHWYKFEVVESGRDSGKFINFEESHFFIKSSLWVARERLVFVTSFHHVGPQVSGIMEATAFSRLESLEESDDREVVSHDFFTCSLEPFVFTWKTTEQEVSKSFGRWLDAALAVAIKEFGDRL